MTAAERNDFNNKRTNDMMLYAAKNPPPTRVYGVPNANAEQTEPMVMKR